MADETFSAFAWHRGVLSERCTLDPYEGITMLALIKFANDRGIAFPGLGLLSKVTRVGRTKLVECLAVLEARGLMRRQAQTRGKGLGSNVYTLPFDPPVSGLEATPTSSPRGLGKTVSTSSPRGLGSSPRGLSLGRPANGGRPPGEPYLLSYQTNGSDHVSAGMSAQPKTPKKRSTKAKTERAAKWRRVPSTWEPNDAHRALATELRLDLTTQVATFRDHEYTQPKTDADAAFRNWLRRAFPARENLKGGVQRGVPNEAEAKNWGTTNALFDEIEKGATCPF